MDSGNRLKSANGDDFTYNDRSLISTRQGSGGTIRYEYNELDMLVRCDINGQVWTASYDGFCRRTGRIWEGRETQFYWDDFRLAAEVSHDGRVRLYLYVDEAALVPFMFVEYNELVAEPGSGQRYYIFTNQIGVPVRVEDDAGWVVWTARIDPYGQALVSADSIIEMPLRFPGHYHDSETGLHNNRFRYYSPELGRYLQSDPLGIEGGINLYAYRDRPLTEVDLDGLAKNKQNKLRRRIKNKNKKYNDLTKRRWRTRIQMRAEEGEGGGKERLTLAKINWTATSKRHRSAGKWSAPIGKNPPESCRTSIFAVSCMKWDI